LDSDDGGAGPRIYRRAWIAEGGVTVLNKPIEGFLEATGEIVVGRRNTVSKHSRASAFFLIIVRSYPGRKKQAKFLGRRTQDGRNRLKEF
jgi:hypothetical protein